MCQKFLSKINKGDKRVFIINGKVCGAISRVPKKGSFLSNMSKGAKPININLTKLENKISKLIAKDLKKENIFFAGIDFIDQKLNGDILKTYYDLSGVKFSKTFLERIKRMNNLSDQKKGSLMAFVAVMFITPDSLFIRLSSIETWSLVFYRGFIPFLTVFVGMLLFYKNNFLKIFFQVDHHGISLYNYIFNNEYHFCCFYSKYQCCKYFSDDCNGTNAICNLGALFLKEIPNKKLGLQFFTFIAAVYIFYDSLKVGNIYGDI